MQFWQLVVGLSRTLKQVSNVLTQCFKSANISTLILAGTTIITTCHVSTPTRNAPGIHSQLALAVSILLVFNCCHPSKFIDDRRRIVPVADEQFLELRGLFPSTWAKARQEVLT